MYMMYQTVYERMKEERVSQVRGENDIRARCKLLVKAVVIMDMSCAFCGCGQSYEL